VPKTRPFIKAKVDPHTGKIARGKICILCERSFFLRLTIAPYRDKTKIKNKTIANLENEVHVVKR
jgi:hypothetical protein